MSGKAAIRLEPDGERMVVEHYQKSPGDYLIYLFHEVSYRFAQTLVRDASVLDLGCGSGYGTAMLAEVARDVVGADVSLSAVEHARREFGRPGVEFIQLSGEPRLPFSNQQFDAVVCFQVIEHVRDHRRFVQEIARVLRPGGAAILATPDRSTRLLPWQKPWNRWHLREYSAATLSALLEAAFESVDMRFMSGTPEVIGIELARCRKLKWATIPFTWPGAPEWFRFRGLTMLRKLQAAAGKSAPDGSVQHGFGVRDLRIDKDPADSVNLVAIVRRPKG